MIDISKSIHPFSLKIKDQRLEEEYLSVSVDQSINQFRFAYIMGIILNIVYLITDVVTFQGMTSRYMQVRFFLVFPALILGLVSTYSPIYKKHARKINLLVVIIAGLCVTLFVYIGYAEVDVTDIYASMILVLIFMYFFFKMPYLGAFCIGTALVVSYALVEYMYVQPPMGAFAFRCLNLFATNCIGATIAYVMEFQFKKEFLLKKILSESVVKDALTDLYNRHYFEQFLVGDIEQFLIKSEGAKRAERRAGGIKAAKYGLFMLDIDFFKSINDTFGHQSGDRVLQQFAKILKDHVRDTDDVLRVGGEEFLIVLKLTTDEYLIHFMKEIGRKVAAYDFKVEDDRTVNCSVSIGLVVLPNFRADDVNELVRYADRALYRSKDRGRNRGHKAYEDHGKVDYQEIIW